MPWYPCAPCCRPEPPPPIGNCDFCLPGTTPAQFIVDLNGLDNSGTGDCTECPQHDSQYVVDNLGEIGNWCAYETDVFISDPDCDIDRINVGLRLGGDFGDEIRVTIRMYDSTGDFDEHTFRLGGQVTQDCSAIGNPPPALNIPYQGSLISADLCDFSDATVAISAVP